MEILLWLVPPVAVTLVAMAWVGWVGREGRGEVDREESVRRLGAALEREQPPRPAATPRRRQRSTGVAVRRTSRTVEPPAAPPAPAEPGRDERRAS